MKLIVKTLKGTQFEIQAHPGDTVLAVKKNIEDIQGKESYPCGKQLLIHNGKVLKDESTLEENKVTADGFLVVMLSKSKASGTLGASSTSQPSSTASAAQPAPVEAPSQPQPPTNVSSDTEGAAASAPSNVFAQAASNFVDGNNLEQIVQQLMDMGGGNWDKDTVQHALRAAYNNPERAVEYLYSGIPAAAEVAIPAVNSPVNHSVQGLSSTEAATTEARSLSGLPNSAPLDMFPQGTSNLGVGSGGGTLDFLRDNHQFQALRELVQANPQILQPMLQELAKQNPELLRVIQDHQAEFLQLINEPSEGDLLDQQEQEIPLEIRVTPSEQEAIERLEALGFEHSQVVEAFLACDRDELLAANYLLEHAGDED